MVVNGVNYKLHYDGNGAIIHYERSGLADKFIEHNSLGQVSKILVGTSASDANADGVDEFAYGPSGARFYKKSSFVDDQGQQVVEHTFLC